MVSRPSDRSKPPPTPRLTPSAERAEQLSTFTCESVATSFCALSAPPPPFSATQLITLQRCACRAFHVSEAGTFHGARARMYTAPPLSRHRQPRMVLSRSTSWLLSTIRAPP
eukprot:6199863-Prymnesium_polylepis.1